MPIFEYHCPECDKNFEAILQRRDQAVSCPECGSDKPEKLLSGFAVTGASPAGKCAAAPSCPSAAKGCCGGHCTGHHH